MTTEISDAARELVEKIISRVNYKRPTSCSWDNAAVNDAQSALTAARNSALEDAAMICLSINNHDNPMTANDAANAIRAMKVES